MWTASLVSAVLGTTLPGPGCIYLGQTIAFTKPVFPGDTVTATVTVLEKQDKLSEAMEMYRKKKRALQRFRSPAKSRAMLCWIIMATARQEKLAKLRGAASSLLGG